MTVSFVLGFHFLFSSVLFYYRSISFLVYKVQDAWFICAMASRHTHTTHKARTQHRCTSTFFLRYLGVALRTNDKSFPLLVRELVKREKFNLENMEKYPLFANLHWRKWFIFASKYCKIIHFTWFYNRTLKNYVFCR